MTLKIITLIAILSNIWIVKKEIKGLSFLNPKVHRHIGGMLIATYTVSLVAAVINIFSGHDFTLVPWMLYLIMMVVVSYIEYAHYDFLVKQEEYKERLEQMAGTFEESEEQSRTTENKIDE